ncbi:SCP2 sterol-binding domain-containing protein [Cellulosilyticum ruminicola]|uniref:SCP2 sterol-binding domain-containing protein n=1 Tax=Cellulosilyticum ruminicola TaxID=425254 RepID=UPI0006D16EED|nr:SCP2 sterol-binding domain-containing protein [Cellulosilyticum ruminicola]
MLAITYSEWLGETEAAERILKSWNILGGIEGAKVCFSKQVSIEEVESRLERETEDFYRLLKQERKNIGCSERMIYRSFKEGISFGNLNGVVEKVPEPEVEKKPEIKSFASMIRTEQVEKISTDVNTIYEAPKVVQAPGSSESHIDLSTKEQTIKEISNLLKKDVDDEFVSMNTGVYRRPNQAEGIKNKKIQQLPHYFIAQHDKSLNAILKYHITDLNEEGYIIIQNGDCVYEESISGMPTVELVLTDEVFKEIQNKRMTYQKAFMLGKLKVKGNFGILPKLDKVFK